MRHFRAIRRQLEIAVLELLARMLRFRPPRRPRWLAAAAACAVLAAVLTVAVLPRATARSASSHRVRAPQPPVTAEPSAPAAGLLSAEAFAGAGRRAPATAPLQRLPQVDLNGLSVAGIPPAALAAYVTAARTTNRSDSTCRLRWWLLAGIGLVEPGHARSGGSARTKWHGSVGPPIY